MRFRFWLAIAVATGSVPFGFAASADAAQQLAARFEIVSRKGSIPKLPGDSGLAITSTTIGVAVSGLPCYNIEAGCGGIINGISIPYPLYLINAGSSYTITVQMHDYAFQGFPVTLMEVVQGGNTIASGKASLPFIGGDSIDFVAFDIDIPTNATGPATILVETTDSATGAVLSKGGTKFVVQ